MGQTIRTVFILSDIPDHCMRKRIDLATSKYDVTVIYWRRNSAALSYKNSKCKVYPINLEVGDEWFKRLPYYWKFRQAVKPILRKTRPDIIHVSGIDMLNVACEYKNGEKQTKIIYEVEDIPHIIADNFENPIKKFVKYYFDKIEKKQIKLVDLLIVTSERFVEIRYNKMIQREKILFVANVPEEEAFKTYAKVSNHKRFTVGYIGVVRYKKQMRNLIEAAKVTDANFIIAGYEVGGNEIEELAKRCENITWIGQFDYSHEVANLYAQCDVVYAVYDADMLNVRNALPNKLYESIYCELPIIVSKDTYLAEVVEDWGIGIAVDYRNSDDLIRAISYLKNNKEMYNFFIDNCKKKQNETSIDFYNAQLRYFIDSWKLESMPRN